MASWLDVADAVYVKDRRKKRDLYIYEERPVKMTY